ncbi:aromatic ring-hydroxylating oxygenase subunit alpha [Aquisediminimonas sediminicola]|uniref:aromatic ring-hydroxylating oxygenase subunit alpha n=1 Tax=Alteraquisediminimonas sediminicola TaxID=2676787 RepID=UPI001C8EE28A|nr:aromatic ring-hydroxylating dioxygenase subunit alpha [Aquisediminimonas sediminicola]
MTAQTRIIADQARGKFLVPRKAFTDQRVFEQEYDAIFNRCWLYLGHASELPEPGSFLTRNVARRPVLFTRDREGTFHALLNACPHRGALVCRERHGKSPAFMCMYHGWVFGADGHLMSLPGAGGYPKGFKTDPQKQMVPVPRLERFGDFFFINFAKDGEDLATYLADAGDYLKLVSEHSASGMQVVGGTQEYAIRGNWKLLAENSFDGYHAACNHSTYLEYLQNANGALGSTPLAGVARDLKNGHALVEYSAPWGRPVANWVPLWGEEGKREIAAIYAALVQRLGDERADRIAHKNRNMVIFPNLVINDIMAITIRTFFPTAPNYMEINAWALAPREESEWLRKYRLYNFTEFLGPGGFATPDDVEAIEKCQQGYAAGGEAQYNDISKGMLREGGASFDDEEQMRAFWVEWDRRLAAVEA